MSFQKSFQKCIDTKINSETHKVKTLEKFFITCIYKHTQYSIAKAYNINSEIINIVKDTGRVIVSISTIASRMLEANSSVMYWNLD